MKKLFLIIFFTYLYGDLIPKCGVFTDVLQTRNNPSEITMQGDGHIYNSPSCNLNTGSIYQGRWYPKLYCNSATAKASKKYGEALTVDYTFLVDSATTSSSPTSSYVSKTINSSQTLTKADYNKINISNWGSATITLTLNSSLTKRINKISLTKNININFTNSTKDLKIGAIGDRWGWNENTNIITSTIPSNIYINDVYLKVNGDMNFQAKKRVEIHNLQVGRGGSEIILKSPKIVIDKLSQTNSGSGTSKIIIYANEIDMGDVDLGQQATLIIHSFDNDHNVTFHSNSITASSSSTMIIESGNYYTNSFSIPGTSSVSSIRALDDNQIINLFINGDFNPGNNPGINSSGNNGNFGTLTPANFRMFINGDLNTGGGGTTFNALIYVEGDAKLGSPTYIKGGLSANNDIKIYNNSKFYYDTSVETSKLGGLCTSSFNFDNHYSCNVFPSVLTSYTKLTTSSNSIYDICSLSVKNKNYVESGSTSCISCNCTDGVCNSDATCKIVESPKNNYSHNVFKTSKTTSKTENSNLTFTNLEYGNYVFNSPNQIIDFSPNNSYDDDSTNLMVFGDIKFNKTGQVLNLDNGDYYFNSFISNGSHFQICLNGDVRIFVKNNFELNGNNINIDCGGNLFVYTEGNATIGNNGGGNNKIHFYLYSKGDVTIKNNAKSSNIYGAITAEGQINVTGNNVNFHYDADKLDNFGVGECKLCYDENYYSSSGFSMFMFSMCTPFSPCELDMPIKNTSNQELDKVKITETYNNSATMTFNFLNMSYYDTIDKNGNHIGNGATKTSSTNYGIYNLVNLSLNPTSVIYDFGDNYPTYQPGDDYYRAYKKSIMSFSISMSPEDLFNQWKEHIVYLAQYTDKNNRNYAIEIDACPYQNNDNQPNGWVDAWDNYLSSRGINDRNISTKIVNKLFNLTLAYIPNGHKVSTSNATVKYYLKDMNTSNIISSEDYLHINSNNYTTTSHSYKIDKAYKNVKVEFKTCANYHSSSGYDLYPYVNCASAGDCPNNTTENKICYRYFTSSDAFAIRPNKFEILGTGVNRADNNITFLNIKALDYLSNNSLNYSELSNNLNMKITDSLCVSDILDYDFNFSNGVANVNYLKYPQVGEVTIKISERDGKEFASIDKDDTADNDRFINSAISNKFTVIPDHFEITDISLKDFNDSTFTYLSKDLNMSGNLFLKVLAKNLSGDTTINYSKECYAKNTTFEISTSANTTMDNLNYVITQYGLNQKDKNISFNLDENNFTNGRLNLNLKINFDRNSSKVVEPFTFTLNSINVTDDNNTKGNKSINLDLNFIYGIMTTHDIVTIESKAVLDNLFEYYNVQKWIRNLNHNNKIYGDIDDFYTSSNVDVTLNEGLISNGEQNISISPNIHSRPYKVKLHFDIPSWLWYSKYGREYQKPNSSNRDCLTHPCSNILFLKKSSKSWGGTGTNEKENNVSKNSIDTDVRENTKKDSRFRKLNW